MPGDRPLSPDTGPVAEARFPDARILIFAKAPQAGRVKTRLIPALGAAAAADLYARLLEATVARAVSPALAPVCCCCAPDTTHPFFRQLADDYPVTLTQQQGADLGERMQTAACTALAEAGSVLLIGGDCPVLDAGHLGQALAWLAAGSDAVVGPAEDGGYVLLGLKRSAPELFREMPWGGERVLRETRARLQRLGWRYRELPPLWDLDRPADLRRYRAMGGGSG